MVRDLVRLGRLGLLLGLGFGLGAGCARILPISPVHYSYFLSPELDDVWSAKIAGWQRRERMQQAGPTAVSASWTGVADVGGSPGDADPVAESAGAAPGEDLRAKYRRFQVERKRQLARDTAEWIQTQAHGHYIPDGPIDHWATLEETLRSDGDDCDGLELLVFHALRELGFTDQEVFRAIVHRPADGQHHMVTLWFEDRGDPWVIDPTGAMTTGMPRMSSLSEWVPLKVFSDRAEFSVGLRSERLAALP